ncbi:hypothetical protein BJ878DRAFT_504498 [Calycina marina]|uniref:Uncharacterized protein n=1 Tax=Calycina marina TaxID=1763456 RepID=A0A9P7Z388_9HELO|nr:hypothetical protein BJ878DRAFT_504498 [Calycina marina]
MLCSGVSIAITTLRQVSPTNSSVPQTIGEPGVQFVPGSSKAKGPQNDSVGLLRSMFRDITDLVSRSGVVAVNIVSNCCAPAPTALSIQSSPALVVHTSVEVHTLGVIESLQPKINNESALHAIPNGSLQRNSVSRRKSSSPKTPWYHRFLLQ